MREQISDPCWGTGEGEIGEEDTLAHTYWCRSLQRYRKERPH